MEEAIEAQASELFETYVNGNISACMRAIGEMPAPRAAYVACRIAEKMRGHEGLRGVERFHRRLLSRV